MLIGIVGKPSSGKSTYFAAATLVDVARAAYPFTTINPNRGMGFVRVACVDVDFNTQCNPRTGFCINHIRFIPVELLDVAGLVPGAHEGKGLGNKFLDDLRQADVLIHVVDASGSTNEKGEAVEPGSHDPCQDILFLEEEIELWMMGILEKNWAKFARQPLTTKQQVIDAVAKGLSGLGVTNHHVDVALNKTKLGEKKLSEWNEEDKRRFVNESRLISKPIVIAANKMDLPYTAGNVERLKKTFPHLLIIPCSAEADLTLRKADKNNLISYIPGSPDFLKNKELNPAQEQALQYIHEKVLIPLNGTGVQRVLDETVFSALGYMAIFPGGTKGLADKDGNIIPDCFLMPPHSTTLDFAFRLHTDFGKNFIKAIDVKTKMLLGKDHLLSNRDVIEIVAGR
ncbi:MAG: redox-regulated ATPase YchF [Candidatus Diapherotrites archaeon]|nr:redox-regulated ATPase YchF [Candidatus Diapherotrites archaeon]MDZ4256325.1 redox-regulated ATPase YchF [archaeon]